jgi:hypothetical protein
LALAWVQNWQMAYIRYWKFFAAWAAYGPSSSYSYHKYTTKFATLQ